MDCVAYFFGIISVFDFLNDGGEVVFGYDVCLKWMGHLY